MLRFMEQPVAINRAIVSTVIEVETGDYRRLAGIAVINRIKHHTEMRLKCV